MRPRIVRCQFHGVAQCRDGALWYVEPDPAGTEITPQELPIFSNLERRLEGLPSFMKTACGEMNTAQIVQNNDILGREREGNLEMMQRRLGIAVVAKREAKAMMGNAILILDREALVKMGNRFCKLSGAMTGERLIAQRDG